MKQTKNKIISGKKLESVPMGTKVKVVECSNLERGHTDQNGVSTGVVSYSGDARACLEVDFVDLNNRFCSATKVSLLDTTEEATKEKSTVDRCNSCGAIRVAHESSNLTTYKIACNSFQEPVEEDKGVNIKGDLVKCVECGSSEWHTYSDRIQDGEWWCKHSHYDRLRPVPVACPRYPTECDHPTHPNKEHADYCHISVRERVIQPPKSKRYVVVWDDNTVCEVLYDSPEAILDDLTGEQTDYQVFELGQELELKVSLTPKEGGE